MNKNNRFLYRIYSDFFMPSRLPIYESLLREALYSGYEVYSVSSFGHQMMTKGLNENKKYLILRHDVDSDVKTAKEMWTIEQKFGVEASYYFRLSTIDINFMQLIQHSGAEASYHYEEIASFCKKYKLKDPIDVHVNMGDIRSIFRENYLFLKKQTGLPMETVAAHGDFVNRILEIPNQEILKDTVLRKELGILFEVYDESIMGYVTKRYSDTLAPDFWKPESPFRSIQRNEHVVYILTHPRHWRKHVLENARDNLRRMMEGIDYHFLR